MTFEDWVGEARKLLRKEYGISPDDCTDEQTMKNNFKAGESPQSFVDWVGEKYDLTRISF